MKKYYKIFITLIIVSFIVPQIAFASWWNPFSWKIFDILRKPQATFTAIVNKLTNQSVDKQANLEREQNQKIIDNNSEIGQDEVKNEETQQKSTNEQENAKNKDEAELLKLIEENKKLKAEQARQELEKIKAKQAKQEAEAQKIKNEQAEQQRLLAQQQEQQRQQELLKQQQAEQARQEQQRQEVERLTKLLEEKRQLESIVASKFNNLVSQLNSIKSQMTPIKAQIDEIKTEYAVKISAEENRLAPMESIYGRIALLTQEMNGELQPLYNQYNWLVDEYNMLLGKPIPITYSQGSTIPQYLEFYPNDSGGGDIYGNGGQFHLNVQRQGDLFVIYGLQ